MNFHQFKIHQKIMQGIDEAGFVEPTPVQGKTIPIALEGKDIRVCAQTGTGKTLAFAIPLLDRWVRQPNSKALILVPTRELGSQVFNVFKQIGTHTKARSVLILGGLNINTQIREIKKGVDIIVATPGRLLDHLQRRTISLRAIETVVLDEADRMLDMGFLPDIRSILSHCRSKHRTWLFSATYPMEIQQLVSQFLKEPVTVDLAPSTPANTVTQMLYPVSRTQKQALLQSLLENANISSALIFCRTKHGADHLVMALKKIGKSVAAIHSNKSQHERDQTLNAFKHKRIQILVATDIASRGIDVKDISHVINFDVPHHPEDYVHRIGRTGRAQATGDAFTLVSSDEEPYIARIEKFIQKTIPRGVIPDFPYLVPPKLISKPKSPFEMFGRKRRKIASSSRSRFKR